MIGPLPNADAFDLAVHLAQRAHSWRATAARIRRGDTITGITRHCAEQYARKHEASVRAIAFYAEQSAAGREPAISRVISAELQMLRSKGLAA